MNGRHEAQLHIDFRTGLPTAITGASVTTEQRQACRAINRSRALGIMEAHRLTSSGESVSPDVWLSIITRRSEEFEVPLIPLEKLGIFRDEDGYLSSSMVALPTGAEARPYTDIESGVVYKLFFLQETDTHSGMGKKLEFTRTPTGELELNICGAKLPDTLKKIQVLHDIGAQATEIVGLTDGGDFLVVKQALAFECPYSAGLNPGVAGIFERDRKDALDAVKALIWNYAGLRHTVAITVLDGIPWLIGDLHSRNIMKGSDERPTIIDALIGPVPRQACREIPFLTEVIERVRTWRETGNLPPACPFADVNDDEL